MGGQKAHFFLASQGRRLRPARPCASRPARPRFPDLTWFCSHIFEFRLLFDSRLPGLKIEKKYVYAQCAHNLSFALFCARGSDAVPSRPLSPDSTRLSRLRVSGSRSPSSVLPREQRVSRLSCPASRLERVHAPARSRHVGPLHVATFARLACLPWAACATLGRAVALGAARWGHRSGL